MYLWCLRKGFYSSPEEKEAVRVLGNDPRARTASLLCEERGGLAVLVGGS